MAEWSDDNVAYARKRRLDGAAHSEIARELHRGGFEVSRNAVIGKLARVGLGVEAPTGGDCRSQAVDREKVAAVRAQRLARERAEQRAVAERAALDRAEVRTEAARPQGRPGVGGRPGPALQAGGAARPLLLLSARACKFPVGNDTGADQLFCGCDRSPGEASYCAEHLRVAVVRRVAVA